MGAILAEQGWESTNLTRRAPTCAMRLNPRRAVNPSEPKLPTTVATRTPKIPPLGADVILCSRSARMLWVDRLGRRMSCWLNQPAVVIHGCQQNCPRDHDRTNHDYCYPTRSHPASVAATSLPFSRIPQRRHVISRFTCNVNSEFLIAFPVGRPTRRHLGPRQNSEPNWQQKDRAKV